MLLLIGFIFLAALLSYVLPAGVFEQRLDAATNREVVITGSYHLVAATRISLGAALVVVPQGLADAASVIFFVFLTGGIFTEVDQTGALHHGRWLEPEWHR